MRIKFWGIVLMAICSIWSGQAQTESLNGEWVLDNIVLYEYSGKDSTIVTNDLLPENNSISGVFDTLTFSGNQCGITIDSNYIESFYRRTEDFLELMPFPVPHNYTILDDKKQLVLYRKYFIVNNEDSHISVIYGVKLTYTNTKAY
jgi:hypothetical protein